MISTPLSNASAFGAASGNTVLGLVPNIYFNGFNLNLSTSDTSLLLLLDGQPQVRVSMSFTTAKTLSAYLVDMINTLEEATNHIIMKTEDVEAGLKNFKKEPKGGV